MKVYGVLRVKDEADLLQEVLCTVEPHLDGIYAYDDGSSDDTEEILRNNNLAKVLTKRETNCPNGDWSIRLLYEEIKKDVNYKKEEVWVVLLAGDYFFLNMNPREACKHASQNGWDSKNAMAINFLRHPREGWDDVDTWPDWEISLRRLCRWVYFAEFLPIAWRVVDYVKWGRLPWPKALRNRDPSSVDEFDRNVVFLEHQGKRSPRYHQWKYLSGSRAIPKKYLDVDFSDIEQAKKVCRGEQYFNNSEIIPWLGMDTLDVLIENFSKPLEFRQAFSSFVTQMVFDLGVKLPERYP
jgi:hypothetical protein